MQEPILYARSVRENILYGLEEEDGGNPGDVPSADDVEQAARLANAHSFIAEWPQGYETVCLPLRAWATAGGVDGAHAHAPPDV